MKMTKRDRIGTRRSKTTRVRRGAPTCSMAIFVALVASGCSTFGGNEGNDSGRVVARAGDWTLTDVELDEEMRGELLKVEIDHAKKIHDAKERYVTFLVDSRLITAEAERRGMTPSELMQAEIGDPAEDTSEEEIRALYDQYRDRIGRSYEETREDLRTVRIGQKREELKAALLERLRSEAGVEIDLPSPPLPVIRIADREDAPVRGPADAPITIVEFSDFQCPFCRRMRAPMDGLLDEYAGQVRIVYRHFPLSSHPLAMPAAEASLCANEQGLFWPYHDLLFEHQETLSPEALRELAAQVELDLSAFDACVADSRYRAAVEMDLAAGREAGVQGTPAYFVNGKPVFGAESIEVFRQLIEQELGAKRG